MTRRERHPAKRTQKPRLKDMELVLSIERAVPGTPLDAQLRREQTRAVLELRAARRNPVAGP